MSRPELTVDEIVSALQHSSLPTVLVEGIKDIQIYRGFEKVLGGLRASFFSCGGRDALLQVFTRRAEFSQLKTCFVADKDMWLFSGIPAGFEELIVTAGYSIENDVYHDSDIERVLNPEESPNHRTMIRELCRWFAFQVEEFSNGRDYRTDPQLYRLIPPPGLICSPDELTKDGFREPAIHVRDDLMENYKLKLRGKLLYQVLVRLTHAKNREPKYPYDVLIDISASYSAQGKLVNQLLDAISKKLEIATPRQFTLPLGEQT